ncbi:1-deoxy-D-xylulose-5-phosphate reductoisomerase [Humibacillus sp. DSM 29435]|nr:1-deoxy-D-xylulose-5-phosphate reductoisomerase [Humibacillus sp. DSM 29435]OFE16626.1 1-deoxy-D-xylulose-5-phosphate reductoisomerase [Humibacillus sp. DSM 29435]
MQSMSTPAHQQLRRRRVILLGSTGSIGTQALDIAQRNPDRFEIIGLSAGTNLELLARQAVALRVPMVAAAAGTTDDLSAAIAHAVDHAVDGSSVTGYEPELLTGPEASTTLAAQEADVVVNGITGAIGLAPTLATLRAGTTLALANKESLIIGGPLVKRAARPGQLVPVDSEHSAIAQCLRGGTPDEVRKLVITASGGPFRGRSRAELESVTVEQALAHPNFSMGPVISTNSATLVNKGLEVIEAHLLFDVPFDRIEVVVHPQQLIHSMVEFTDGSTMAQAGPPSMLVPIALGMAWPDRVPDAGPSIDWTRAASWSFEPLDHEAFPAVALAKRVGEAGGTWPAVYNAANEVCVQAFFDGALRFVDIVDTVAKVVERYAADPAEPVGELTLEQVLAADGWARSAASSLVAP